MNAHTTTAARLQSLIKGLDPAKVTPELQAMIAAHMAGHVKPSQKKREAKPPTGKRGIIFLEKQDQVLALLSDNAPRKMQEIADRLGLGRRAVDGAVLALVDKKAIYRSLRPDGTGVYLYSKQPLKFHATPRDAKILDMYRKGAAGHIIAKALGMSRSAVCAIISRLSTMEDRKIAAVARHERDAKARYAKSKEAHETAPTLPPGRGAYTRLRPGVDRSQARHTPQDDEPMEVSI